MTRLRLISLFLLVLGLVTVGRADAQKLMLFGNGTIRLDVQPSTFGTDAVAEDNTTSLMWNRTQERSKVTVSTFAPGQQFTLRVEAMDVRYGQSVGQVALVDGMMDTDLIVNIDEKKAGKADIRYIAEARIDQGASAPGQEDQHTVTFTLTEQ